MNSALVVGFQIETCYKNVIFSESDLILFGLDELVSCCHCHHWM